MLSQPLMSRVKGKFFLQMTPSEQREHIELIRATRVEHATTQKVKAGRPTKSAVKNRKKRKAKPKMSEAQLEKLLAKLTPDQLEAMKTIYG